MRDVEAEEQKKEKKGGRNGCEWMGDFDETKKRALQLPLLLSLLLLGHRVLPLALFVTSWAAAVTFRRQESQLSYCSRPVNTLTFLRPNSGSRD